MMSEKEVQEVPLSSDEEFDSDGEIDSESSSDVDAKLAEEEVFDIEFFKCYSALKKKDEKIYDKSVKFFNEEEDNKSSDSEGEEVQQNDDNGKTLNSDRKKFKTPKMTLLDHQLNLLDNDSEFIEPKVDLNKEVSKSFYEKELDEIKKSIEKVSENVDSDDDDDELLVVKGGEASKPKKKIQEMLDKLEKDEDEDVSHLKQIWSDSSKLSKSEKFLRDYIVNKLYIPNDLEEKKDNDGEGGFFSKNLDELSDVDDEEEKQIRKKHKIKLHSEEKDFDKLTRIPRNSTKTIRDLVEKREKKEKRMKSLEKEKKRKKAVKDADCEDIIGDLPTKFHYRETEPNDYGLSAEELLMATDEELEQWVKLKDAIAYRSQEEELEAKRRFDQKRHDLELKKKVFMSIYGDTNDVDHQDEAEVETTNTRKKNKKRKRKSSNNNIEDSNVNEPEPGQEKVLEEEVVEDTKQENPGKRKKKHKRGLSHKKFTKTGVAPDRLLAYGLSKTKLKKSKLL